MRLQSDERFVTGVPARILDTLERVRMETRGLGESFLGIARELQVGTDAIDKIQSGRFEGAAFHRQDKSTSQRVLQAHNHTGMGKPADIRWRMTKTPDERRDLLRTFMTTRNLKTARWAKDSGVAANSIYNFLNGHSDALDLRTYGKLARTAAVPVWRLTGDQPEPPSPTSVWVAGHVEAGNFQTAMEWDQSLWYAVDVPVPDRFRRLAKALEVRGPSMNRDYPQGSIVLWVDMLAARAPRDGDHVIVYAHQTDDSIEATVKELRVTDGKRWLWPKSDDPLHQLPLDTDHPGDGVASIEIVGLVIGDYRPRHI